MLKTYLKCYGYLFILIFILTLILSIINYFLNIPIDIMKIIIPIISILTVSIILGKNIKEKAYLEGLKFVGIYLIITTIIKFIKEPTFNLKTIIIYILVILTSVIGSMIGINFKKK